MIANGGLYLVSNLGEPAFVTPVFDGTTIYIRTAAHLNTLRAVKVGGDSALKEPMISLRDRFIQLAYERISRIKPMIPMSNKPFPTGANSKARWREISDTWVSMNGNPHTVSLCLETIWNYKNSNTQGYRAVGANLAAAVREYLAERPAR